MIRALGKGGGGGPVNAAGLWGKTTGVGWGIVVGLGSRFSLSSSKNSVVEYGNGRSSGRGEGVGVLLADLTASGTRQPNRQRWVADPRGTSCSPASTKMVKLRLPWRFFLDTTDVKGDGVVGDSEEGDDKGVKGVEGVRIGVTGVEGEDRQGVEGRLLLAERMGRVRKTGMMLMTAKCAWESGSTSGRT
jgi:hypothetical protein